MDSSGNGRAAVPFALTTLADVAVPVYEAATGTAVLTTGQKVTSSRGVFPAFVEEGSYKLTVEGVTTVVEAVSGRALGWTTPYAHGAVGDGVADDHAAVVAALASGRDVWLPEGGRFMVRGVVVPSDTVIDGPGALVVSPATGIYPIYVQPGSHDIRLRNFEIDGNKAAFAGNPDVPGFTLTTDLGFPQAAVMVAGTSGSPCRRIFCENLYVHDHKRLGVVYQNVQVGRVKAHIKGNSRDGCTLYFNCRDVDLDLIVEDCADDYVGINSGDGATVGKCERINVKLLAIGPSTRGKGRGMYIRGGSQIRANIIAYKLSSTAVEISPWPGVPVTDFDIHVQAYQPGAGLVVGAAIAGESYTVGEASGVHFTVGTDYVRGGRITGRVDGANYSGVRHTNNKGTPADGDIADLLIDVEALNCAHDGVGMNTLGCNDITVRGRYHGNAGWGFTSIVATKRVYVEGKFYANTSGGVRMLNVAGGALRSDAYNNPGTGILIENLSGVFDFDPGVVTGNGTNYTDSGGHTATAPGVLGPPF